MELVRYTEGVAHEKASNTAFNLIAIDHDDRDAAYHARVASAIA